MLVRDLLAGKNKEMFECAVKVFDCENSIIDPLYDSQDAKKPSDRVLDIGEKPKNFFRGFVTKMNFIPFKTQKSGFGKKVKF